MSNMRRRTFAPAAIVWVVANKSSKYNKFIDTLLAHQHRHYFHVKALDPVECSMRIT